MTRGFRGIHGQTAKRGEEIEKSNEEEWTRRGRGPSLEIGGNEGISGEKHWGKKKFLKDFGSER